MTIHLNYLNPPPPILYSNSLADDLYCQLVSSFTGLIVVMVDIAYLILCVDPHNHELVSSTKRLLSMTCQSLSWSFFLFERGKHGRKSQTEVTCTVFC